MNAKKGGEIAVSLLYDGERAPTVTAKGEGDVARKIMEVAREHEVPIYQNAPLTSLLSKVDLNMEVPESLYVVVAEIIAFAYRLKDQVPADYVADNAPIDEPVIITPSDTDLGGELDDSGDADE